VPPRGLAGLTIRHEGRPACGWNTAAMDSGRTREVFGQEVEWGADPGRPDMGWRRFRCGCVLAEKDRGDWRVRAKCDAFEQLHRAKLSGVHVLLDEEVDWD
jgi:hypothetical protein